MVTPLEAIVHVSDKSSVTIQSTYSSLINSPTLIYSTILAIQYAQNYGFEACMAGSNQGLCGGRRLTCLPTPARSTHIQPGSRSTNIYLN